MATGYKSRFGTAGIIKECWKYDFHLRQFKNPAMYRQTNRS